MCGIYGTNKKISAEIIHKKLKRINHRGPDFSAFSTQSEITLGHNRLSILDLNDRSNQPLIYDRYTIVFNGEIYNFQELKQDLSALGYHFRTESDTEVICAAYDHYREQCLDRLNGMFAFVIHDQKANKLYGARDRVGQKPLYYALQNNSIEFCSQVSPLKIANNFTIDNDAVMKYLQWKYIPEPDSIYKEVKQLKAGHYFVYDLDICSFTEHQYWDITKPVSYTITSKKEADELLENLLSESIRRRFLSDVPLGLFLSGGVDSSLITAIAKKVSNQRISTYSISFDREGYDESQYAKKVSDYLDTDHKTLCCDINEAIELIQNHNYYFDEPFADSSSIPSMLLAKLTKQYATVALSGDGGDELFYGYNRYFRVDQLKYLYRIPKFLRSAAYNNLKAIVNKDMAPLLYKSDMDLYVKKMTDHNSPLLFHKSPTIESPYLHYLDTNNNSLLRRMSDFEIKTYLTSDINTKIDRSSMAYSLEVRSPLLDHTIISFSRQCPLEYIGQKDILKRILYKHLPKEFFERKKAGFNLPIKHWLRSELREFVLDTITQEQVAQFHFLNYEEIEKMVNSHMMGIQNNERNIWKLLILLDWYQKYGND